MNVYTCLTVANVMASILATLSSNTIALIMIIDTQRITALERYASHLS